MENKTVHSSGETASLSECLTKTTHALGLIREIRKQTKDVVKSYEFIGGVDPQLQIEDMLYSLAELLKSRTDGRPQPFSVYDVDGFVLTCPDSNEEKLNLERELRIWAEPGPLSKKYPDEPAAYIGRHQFKLPDLIQLRDWMSSVIEWHRKGEQQ